MKLKIAISAILFACFACSSPRPNAAISLSEGKAPFVWENANMYFLMTDRFYNADKANDVNFDRSVECAKLRGFMGGDIKGITQKIEDGYFDQLGINAIWFTPVVEQDHGVVNEGYGDNYGFHGYWAQDWTRLDPNFGTEEELAEMVQKAHRHGIRVVMDVVVNHTGPVTSQDPVWPSDWVRETPECKHNSYETSVPCALVKNLPDILTESNANVDLPQQLVEKWKKEGRYEKEKSELDAFFNNTGYPRAPRFYIYKWLTDYVRKYGFDGFRCDTTKHTEASVWEELRKDADKAFADWKKAHPDQVLDDNAFYMVGEVYGYSIQNDRMYDYGDRKVDFFQYGLDGLINFSFKEDAKKSYETLFSRYSSQLAGPLKGKMVLNYLSSHDDGGPFDKERTRCLEAGTKLLLCPGQAQVYYGDETARMLDIPGTSGDATLRSFMNWEEINNGTVRNGFRVSDVLSHWQKLGQFRRAHPAVGAGVHKMMSAKPYVFKRVYTKKGYTDAVMVGLDMPKGKKEIMVRNVFADGTVLQDYYSGLKVKVSGGKVVVDSGFDMVLLGK
ncbi:MAG: alpha-amylase [Lewinellaceae bacterium]|nr:alpha-amylase [Lewinellaceae bacterium]